MVKREFRKSLIMLTRIGILLFVLSVSLFAQGKNPVIFIPGLSGSELKHKETGEKIWFNPFRSKSGDLRLPISTDITKNHDNLIAGDIIRTFKIGVLPITDIYGGCIKALELRAGYHEESWDKPSMDGYEDSIYIFSYDWRLNNVENARLLINKLDELKRKLKKPDLKFDIIAHSMGGIISRYAAMYGDADLPDAGGKPVPTWAGARYFDKIILLGTPNEGSALSLDVLVNGVTLGGVRIELPFIQDTSRFTAFTIPSAYELLPAPGTLRSFNDRLEPVNIDIYDPKVWSKYGWNAIDDKGFSKVFNVEEQKTAPGYFAMQLNRAKRLHEALDAAPGKSGGISFYTVGADCKTALDSIVVYRDEKNDKWKTLFRPKGFTRADGVKITDNELKKVMYSPGDGIVTRRSFKAINESRDAGVESILKNGPGKFICEEHNKLAANAKIQDYIIGVLDNSKVKNVTGSDPVH